MAPRTPNDLLDAFVADGNQVIGPRPAHFLGTFDMVWSGGGSRLAFEDGVRLSKTKLSFTNGGGSIRIEAGVTVKGWLEVSGGGQIRIGAGTFLNRVCDIRGAEGAIVDIGKNCLFSDVKVQTSDMHSILDIATGKRTNPAAGITIEDNVWVAEDVKIAKGMRIGTGAVIAAGSLVTRSVAPFSIAAGRPAKVIRSGVRWTRSLQKMPAQSAPDFKPLDIPLEKNTLSYLMECKNYALVEAVTSAGLDATLGAGGSAHDMPLFARWYLVSSRYKLRIAQPDAIALLDGIIAEAPAHNAARALREKLHAIL